MDGLLGSAFDITLAAHSVVAERWIQNFPRSKILAVLAMIILHYTLTNYGLLYTN